MPYNYFQQKAIYDQMNGTAQREQERATAAKREKEKLPPERPRAGNADPNQIAKLIVGLATGTDAASSPKTTKKPKGGGKNRSAKKAV